VTEAEAPKHRSLTVAALFEAHSIEQAQLLYEYARNGAATVRERCLANFLRPYGAAARS
jgi:hypothetical protein